MQALYQNRLNSFTVRVNAMLDCPCTQGDFIVVFTPESGTPTPVIALLNATPTPYDIFFRITLVPSNPDEFEVMLATVRYDMKIYCGDYTPDTPLTDYTLLYRERAAVFE